MATLSEAAEFAARWAENQRGVVALSEALSSLGSMEQATKERKVALAAATKAHEAKLAEIAKAEAALDDLATKRVTLLHEHGSAIAQSAAEAEQRAAAIVLEAQERARALVASAEGEAQRIQQAQAEKLADMNAQLEATRVKVAEAQRTYEATAAGHETVARRIEELKATARGILG